MMCKKCLSILYMSYLETNSIPRTTMQPVNTKSQFGGKTMKKTYLHNKTHSRGRGTFIKNWSRQQPSFHERTMMLKKCGKKCFLGPKKSFPICTRRTCKINRKGVYAAYMRANEYKTIRPNTQKYSRISSKAHSLLKKLY